MKKVRFFDTKRKTACRATLDVTAISLRELALVELDEKTSNSLLEVLEDWDTVLRAEEIFKHPAMRGPRP